MAISVMIREPPYMGEAANAAPQYLKRNLLWLKRSNYKESLPRYAPTYHKGYESFLPWAAPNYKGYESSLPWAAPNHKGYESSPLWAAPNHKKSVKNN